MSPSSPPDDIEVSTSPAPLAKANSVTLAKISSIFKYSDILSKAGVYKSSAKIAINLKIKAIHKRENSNR
jgi:hypothetical protein